LMDDDLSTSEIADELDVSASTVRNYVNYVEAKRQSDEVDGKYQEEFEALLDDKDISQQMTSSAKDDGLSEATEGMEVDVDM
ncbi:MAG: HTH domain-containing protein, partial [Halobacteria archaeon]|nr:HTH domain-containing protein [Halobacteria archaeon]